MQVEWNLSENVCLNVKSIHKGFVMKFQFILKTLESKNIFVKLVYFLKMDNELKIMTLNCNGISDNLKRRDIFDRLRNLDCNIFFLQETHLKAAEENLIRAGWGYEVIVAGNSSQAGGTAILFNNNFEFQVIQTQKDPNGQYIFVKVKFLEKVFLLVNIYGPSAGDDDGFFQNIDNFLENQDQENIIIGGDFNCVLDPNLDRKNCTTIVNRPRTRAKIIDIMTKHTLTDIYRNIYPDTPSFTWRRFNTNKQARLDYFLVSENLCSEISNIDTSNKYKSDHAPVILTMRKNAFIRDRPYWKFNNSLLYDKEYVDLVKKSINEIKKEYCTLVYNLDDIYKIPLDEIQFRISEDLILEVLLMNIRGKTISYASHKKKQDTKLE